MSWNIEKCFYFGLWYIAWSMVLFSFSVKNLWLNVLEFNITKQDIESPIQIELCLDSDGYNLIFRTPSVYLILTVCED